MSDQKASWSDFFSVHLKGILNHSDMYYTCTVHVQINVHVRVLYVIGTVWACTEFDIWDTAFGHHNHFTYIYLCSFCPVHNFLSMFIPIATHICIHTQLPLYH